jgi:hypothetical protein
MPAMMIGRRPSRSIAAIANSGTPTVSGVIAIA